MTYTFYDTLGPFTQLGSDLNQDGPGNTPCPLELGYHPGDWPSSGSWITNPRHQVALLSNVAGYELVAAWVEPHWDSTNSWWTWVGPYVAGWDGSTWTVLGGSSLETSLRSMPYNVTGVVVGDRFLPGEVHLAWDGTNLFTGYMLCVGANIPAAPSDIWYSLVAVVKYWDGSAWTEIVQTVAAAWNTWDAPVGGEGNNFPLFMGLWASETNPGKCFLYTSEDGPTTDNDTDPDYFGPAADWLNTIKVIGYNLDGSTFYTWDVVSLLASGASTPPRPPGWGSSLGWAVVGAYNGAGNLILYAQGQVDIGGSFSYLDQWLDTNAKTITVATHSDSQAGFDCMVDSESNFIGGSGLNTGEPNTNLAQSPDAGGDAVSPFSMNDLYHFGVICGLVIDGDNLWGVCRVDQNLYLNSNLNVVEYTANCLDLAVVQEIPNFVSVDYGSGSASKDPDVACDTARNLVYAIGIMGGGFIQVFSAEIDRGGGHCGGIPNTPYLHARIGTS